MSMFISAIAGHSVDAFLASAEVSFLAYKGLVADREPG